MEDSMSTLGAWLASEVARLVPDSHELRVGLLGFDSLEQVAALLQPVLRRQKPGAVVWAEGLEDVLGERGLAKVRAYNPAASVGAPPFAGDVFVMAPHYAALMNTLSMRTEVLRALTLLAVSDTSRLVLCVPSTLETNPLMLRARVFGLAPFAGAGIPEDAKTLITEEEMIQVLESIGFAYCPTQHLDSRMNISAFLRGKEKGIRDMCDWLGLPMENCMKAGSSEHNLLRRLCAKGTEDILQPKTIISVPLPLGFEHDSRAQPSPSAWWPSGQRTVFRDHGYETWKVTRERWAADGSTISGPPNHPGRTSVPVPKLSVRELNVLVETLATNHDRIELPGSMRLDDLLDVLADVWESMDDA